MIDIIERTRKMFNLPPVKYIFIDTGLEMKATREHVKRTSSKYGVEIKTCKPKVNIVMATRTYGVPFISKFVSEALGEYYQKPFPLDIVDEYNKSEDKEKCYFEIRARYPKRKHSLTFMLCCNSKGEPQGASQSFINSSKYLLDFIKDFPPDFQISAKCCDYCKKRPAHIEEKDCEIVITGERRAEGGIRAAFKTSHQGSCISELSNGKFRLRPLYYVSDADKAWYKEYYDIEYSDAYEVYGLTRTGCCGCPISSKAVEVLEKIGKYEPNIVKGAWNIFGKSYEYRAKYNEYKKKRMDMENEKKKELPLQMNIFDAQ